MYYRRELTVQRKPIEFFEKARADWIIKSGWHGNPN